MIEKGNNSLSFRERISQAPEFTKPYTARFIGGDSYNWPFQGVKLSEKDSEEKMIFEAKSDFSIDKEISPIKVQVSYEDGYDLKVRKEIISKKFRGSDEWLMGSGEIKYSFGEIAIIFLSNIYGPFIGEESHRDIDNFRSSISVIVPGQKEVPPITDVIYDSSSQIPIDSKFSCADYADALKGNVEKRGKNNAMGSTYKYTYFQWEQLVGAKVGIARYDDPRNPDYQNYYRWVTRINNPSFIELEGSPYKAKISMSEGRYSSWKSNRLRFSRINSQTGEIWMFSIPAWIDKKEFYNSIQGDSLGDFCSKYPVIFCVKKKDEEKKWFTTASRHDLAR